LDETPDRRGSRPAGVPQLGIDPDQAGRALDPQLAERRGWPLRIPGIRAAVLLRAERCMDEKKECDEEPGKTGWSVVHDRPEGLDGGPAAPGSTWRDYLDERWGRKVANTYRSLLRRRIDPA